jgi:hypothetical protein
MNGINFNQTSLFRHFAAAFSAPSAKTAIGNESRNESSVRSIRDELTLSHQGRTAYTKHSKTGNESRNESSIRFIRDELILSHEGRMAHEKHFGKSNKTEQSVPATQTQVADSSAASSPEVVSQSQVDEKYSNSDVVVLDWNKPFARIEPDCFEDLEAGVWFNFKWIKAGDDNLTEADQDIIDRATQAGRLNYRRTSTGETIASHQQIRRLIYINLQNLLAQNPLPASVAEGGTYHINKSEGAVYHAPDGTVHKISDLNDLLAFPQSTL